MVITETKEEQSSEPVVNDDSFQDRKIVITRRGNREKKREDWKRRQEGCMIKMLATELRQENKERTTREERSFTPNTSRVEHMNRE